jgi:hypothetical protein
MLRMYYNREDQAATPFEDVVRDYYEDMFCYIMTPIGFRFLPGEVTFIQACLSEAGKPTKFSSKQVAEDVLKMLEISAIAIGDSVLAATYHQSLVICMPDNDDKLQCLVFRKDSTDGS